MRQNSAILFGFSVLLALVCVPTGSTWKVPLLNPGKMVKALAINFSQSVALVFSPIEPMHIEDVVKIPSLKSRKRSRSNNRKRAHKQHKWDYEDMANDFAARYILQGSSGSKARQAVVQPNHDTDVADYLARGVSQALSPLNTSVPSDSRCMPPFRKQVKLSKLRSALKKNRRHFSDA